MVALEAQRTVDIEAVGGAGDGVARDDAGAPLYVPFTLPGERAVVVTDGDRVRPVGCRRSARARPPAVPALRPLRRLRAPALGPRALPRLEGGPDPRRPGPRADRDRLRPGLRRPAGLPPAGRPPRPPRGGRPELGYKRRGAWSLVDIAVCPISDPRLVAAFPALRRLGGAFLGRPKSAPTLHVTLTETGLDVDVTGVEKKGGGVNAATYAARGRRRPGPPTSPA
jgi:23S rRNA (uracil1939-C5)-methyltransferase